MAVLTACIETEGSQCQDSTNRPNLSHFHWWNIFTNSKTSGIPFLQTLLLMVNFQSPTALQKLYILVFLTLCLLILLNTKSSANYLTYGGNYSPNTLIKPNIIREATSCNVFGTVPALPSFSSTGRVCWKFLRKKTILPPTGTYLFPVKFQTV